MVEASNPGETIEASAVRAQLGRMLTHPLFMQSERQSRFLKYIVEETLTGGGRRLNQFVIGVDVFDRDASFDPAIDSIVRVEAGRLRAKLREYYAEVGQGDPVWILLPKGRYATVFQSGGPAVGSPHPANGSAGHPASQARPIVAVLPFDNRSDDPEQEYFSDGIAEDLITELSRVSGIGVMSRQSTFIFKGKSAPAQQVCEELGADHVVHGSVRKAGTRVRITAQLVDGRTGQQRWADRYDRELLDIFSVQDEVVQKIASALQVTLTNSGTGRTSRKGAPSVEAYDCVLRGQEYARSFRREDLLQARALFRRAMTLDANYAEAHASLARVLVYEWIAGFSTERDRVLPEALDLAQRAVALDPDSAITHSTLGWTHLWMDDYNSAIVEGEKAIELDQSSAFALSWMAMCQAWAGKTEEAAQLLERAMQLNPVEPYYYARGLIYYVKNQLREAADLFEKSVRNNLSFVPARLYLASCYGLLGQEQAGRAEIAAIMSINPGYRTSGVGDPRHKDPALAARFATSLQRLGLP